MENPAVVVVKPKPSNGITAKVIDLIEKVIVKFMYDSSVSQPWLSGNFAPVSDETPPLTDLHVIGHLPEMVKEKKLIFSFDATKKARISFEILKGLTLIEMI